MVSGEKENKGHQVTMGDQNLGFSQLGSGLWRRRRATGEVSTVRLLALAEDLA